ncbi:MAG: N-acetylglucosamine-6-phosphate deacetylase [Hyphomicrobiales bacterium]|nr:N-acetylglucosamine-6-phosphate deacetylase [Hyphomicrobiales bacterium]
MSEVELISGADIFDGHHRHTSAALVIENSVVKNIVSEDKIPSAQHHLVVDGGLIVPGFIDLQVNGGGGVLFNDQPNAKAIETICNAHAQFGTTGLLPTLITDSADQTRLAINAGIEAQRRKTPGFLGLHLEGPHLSVAKKGAHDPSLIRPMTNGDLAQLLAAKQELQNLLVTVAPESVGCGQIETLAANGVVVSLGHSNASYVETGKAVAAGAQSVTHLYNAMSACTHREPGLVGAALEYGGLYAGLIADGHHVDPAVISIALKAKNGPGRIFLVTDAMSTIGTNDLTLSLNGRTISRSGGKLTLEDGTLAGADLDMISAVRYMADTVGIGLEEAIRMASLYPAQCMNIDHTLGHLLAGAKANFLHLDDKQNIRQVWIDGKKIFS